MPDDAGGERRRDGRMREIGRDELLELGHELMNALGRHVELEQLHRDEAILIGFVCAKHRTERSGADLMQNTKWTERVGKRRAGSFRVQ